MGIYSRESKAMVRVTCGIIVLFFVIALVVKISQNDSDESNQHIYDVVDNLVDDMRVDSIPIVRLDSGGKEISDRKGVWTDGISITIEDNGGVFLKTSGKIKPRGTSSYSLGVKYGSLPYKIKFTEMQDLFGWGANKNYLLIPSTIDPTALRNYIVYKTGKYIMGENWTPEVKIVEVYQNGEYLGLYDLVESIEVDETRIDIAGQNTNVDEIPFIAELEMQKQDNRLYQGQIGRTDESFRIDFMLPVNYRKRFNFQEKAYATFELKYPDSFNDISEAQGDYIVSRMNQLYSGLHDHVDLDEIGIDIASFAKYYVVMDVFYNYGSRSSLYYTCDGEKIYAGPIWDYDRALTNFSTRHFLYKFTTPDNSDMIYDYLFQYDDFNDAITNEFENFYENIAPDLKIALNELRNNNTLNEAWQRNEELHRRLTNTELLYDIYDAAYVNDEIERRKTYVEQVDYIIGFLFDGLEHNGDDTEMDQPGRIEWMHENLSIWREAHPSNRE